MKSTIPVRQSRSQRGKGQAILEGTAMLVIIVPVAVLLVLLVLNVGFVLMHQQKLNMVAAEVAKVVAAKRYFLGVEVPTFQSRRAEIEGQARKVCSAMLSRLNLPDGEAKFDYADVEGTSSSLVGCSVSVSRIKLFSDGLVFPSLIELTGVGWAAQDGGGGTSNQGEPIIARLAISQQNGPHRWVLYLPAYNAQKEIVGYNSGFLATEKWPANHLQIQMAVPALWEGAGFKQFRVEKGHAPNPAQVNTGF